MISSSAKAKLYRLFGLRNKYTFILQLQDNATVLDIGCGNHSPSICKQINPRIQYFGIDIGPYNLSKQDYSSADELSFFPKNEILPELMKRQNRFDAVICSHVIEHVETEKRVEFIEALSGCLKSTGRCFLSFPSEASLHFPSRPGTLNYLDDPTHLVPAPNIDHTVKICERVGLLPQFVQANNKPLVLWTVGLLLEPLSRALNRCIGVFTWSFYGFENIIVMQKK